LAFLFLGGRRPCQVCQDRLAGRQPAFGESACRRFRMTRSGPGCFRFVDPPLADSTLPGR